MVLCSGVADLMVLCCGVAITGPGRLLLGGSLHAEEATLSGLGNSIRMMMSHFVELKRCPVARKIAFRKARL